MVEDGNDKNSNKRIVSQLKKFVKHYFADGYILRRTKDYSTSNSNYI
jgi:hypothetical protein